jgi:7-dehydrocholesterol reductase
VLICPVLVIVIQIALQNFQGSLADALAALYDMGPLDFAVEYAPRFDLHATLMYAAWVLLQVALYAFLPSAPAYGQRTPAGHLLPYRVNGLNAWILCHAAVFTAVYLGVLDPAIIAKNWNGLIVAFNMYGYFLPAMAYVKAHLWPTHADDVKFSGSMIYDYYMGIELNPRFGNWFDFKLFHNGRPGILAWTLM